MNTCRFLWGGPLRDENGMCVPHEANTTERRVQDGLVIVSHVVSLLVTTDWHLKACLMAQGTMNVHR